MNEHRKRFVIVQDGRGNWQWSLLDKDLAFVVRTNKKFKTRDECIADTQRLAEIATATDVWDAESQQWALVDEKPCYQYSILPQATRLAI
jgi:hypothetical protein